MKHEARLEGVHELAKQESCEPQEASHLSAILISMSSKDQLKTLLRLLPRTLKLKKGRGGLRLYGAGGCECCACGPAGCAVLSSGLLLLGHPLTLYPSMLSLLLMFSN